MAREGFPTRPIGFIESAKAAMSGLLPSARMNAALLAAGQMALTVTPNGAHSRAAVRVRARSASLAGLYSRVPLWALTPFRLQTLIPRPQPRARMCGKAARIAQNGP